MCSEYIQVSQNYICPGLPSHPEDGDHITYWHLDEDAARPRKNCLGVTSEILSHQVPTGAQGPK